VTRLDDLSVNASAITNTEPVLPPTPPNKNRFICELPATATGAKYPEVSSAFWNATHDVLSGQATAEDSLKKLEGKLKQVQRGKW